MRQKRFHFRNYIFTPSSITVKFHTVLSWPPSPKKPCPQTHNLHFNFQNWYSILTTWHHGMFIENKDKTSLIKKYWKRTTEQFFRPRLLRGSWSKNVKSWTSRFCKVFLEKFKILEEVRSKIGIKPFLTTFQLLL